jgi:hypothetical protein
MDRNKIDSEIKALQSGFAGNDAIYMGKRNGIEVGYLAAVKKYEGSIADLQAKCERYEKALNEIMDKSIDPDNDDAPAATLYGINLAATEALAGDGEKEVEKTFSTDQVQSMLIEFALAYYKAPNKDIANDAAEYLYGNLNQKEDKQ